MTSTSHPATHRGPPRRRSSAPIKRSSSLAWRPYPELSAVRLLEEIRLDGYTGGYSQLRDYVREVRPRPAPSPVVRFETPAGHQAQVDFAEFDFPWGKRYALLVVLGYSRLLWLGFYPRQDMRTLFVGLEEAFRYFGGITRELLFDQMKAVITADLRLLGGQLVINEEFLRFAAHWGFRPRACRAYRAQTKGKVERPIRYVRENLVYGRDFIGDDHLDEERLRWLERANGRTHATTKEVPRLRFERDEKHLLLPLAEQSYRSLVLPPIPEALVREEVLRRVAIPKIAVEKRPLSVYAAVAKAVAGGGL
ncbi:MAG TPA: IS21 family transposase [Allosphingosinicella sp.]|nr:IS21 family transposase [Allosphingosinicella sp.]